MPCQGCTCDDRFTRQLCRVERFVKDTASLWRFIKTEVRFKLGR